MQSGRAQSASLQFGDAVNFSGKNGIVVETSPTLKITYDGQSFDRFRSRPANIQKREFTREDLKKLLTFGTHYSDMVEPLLRFLKTFQLTPSQAKSLLTSVKENKNLHTYIPQILALPSVRQIRQGTIADLRQLHRQLSQRTMMSRQQSESWMTQCMRESAEIERRLGALLQPVEHATDSKGMEWWCLPLSPPPEDPHLREILATFERLVRWMIRLVEKTDVSKKGKEESLDTLYSTILILRISLRQLPDDVSQFVIRNTSIFQSISMDTIQQSVQRRRVCRGFLVLARYRDRHVMSMTVWERTLITTIGEPIECQEHALIVRNPFPAQQRMSNISMRMHSFAADAVKKPVVVCDPYYIMAGILEKQIKNGTIDRFDRPLSSIPGDPCLAFGQSFQIVNDEKLKGFWKQS